MEIRVTDVADGIYELTTVVPDLPVVFNQYLIAGAELTLFHGPAFALPVRVGRCRQRAAASLRASSRPVASRYSLTHRSITAAVFSTFANWPTT